MAARMTGAFLTIDSGERDTLHWLMARRLFILGQDPPALALNEGIDLDQLASEFGEDLELMEILGWEVEDERKTVALTMPTDRLVKTLKRLRRDARRAPCEERHELEARDSDAERWERFRQAVDTCEELLDLLDSPNRDEDEEPRETACPLATSASELSPLRLSPMASFWRRSTGPNATRVQRRSRSSSSPSTSASSPRPKPSQRCILNLRICNGQAL